MDFYVEPQGHFAKSGHKLRLEYRCAAGTTVKFVSTHFATMFGLSPATCKLYYQGSELTDQTLQQLRTDETPPIRLSACFDNSVSTCIWLSLPAQLGIDIAEFWTASAVFLADQANWSILRLADGQALSSFVGLGPGDAVPPDLDLTDMNIKSLSWSEVSTPTRPILLLVQNVLHMALIHQNDGTAIDSINKATTQMNNNIRHVRLHQDISVAAAGPVMSHIKSLRAALLMLKTVQLLLLIKLQMLLKVQAEAAQLRTLSIQRAVGALCQGILTVSSEASDRLNDAPGMQLTAAEKKEAELLSVLLVKMALPVMKQMLKDKILPSAFVHDWNCRLLISLLPRNSPTTSQAVAAEVTSSGGIPIMVAALDSSGTLAAKAIDMLLSQSNEQLEATETVLVNLQAVPRLCKLLPPDIPGWTGDEEDEVQGKRLRSNLHSEVQKMQWFGGVTYTQFGQLTMTAHIINRLLTRQNASLCSPSSLMKHLPTPTPAVWEGVMRSLDLAFKYNAFYSGVETSCPMMLALQSLQAQLRCIPFNLLAGHLQNMDLDVTEVVRTHLKKIMLLSDCFNDAESPLVALLMALLRRVARDPSILTLTPDEVRGTVRALSRHKGLGVCQGCPFCNGPNWHFKTESVAALWTMCCGVCKHRASDPVAAVTVDALYSALTDPEQCKHLLLHTHTVMGEGLRSNTEEGLDGALRGLRGELTSQLTLGACLFRLCAQEGQLASRGLAPGLPFFTQALHEGTLEHVCTLTDLALATPAPWDTERCVALARVLTARGDLCKAVPVSGSDKYEECNWGVVADLLPQLPKVTGLVVLQHTLLQAALCFLGSSAANPPSTPMGLAVRQEVVKLLIDVLVRPESQPPPDTIHSSSPLCPTSSDFSQVGLGPADMSSLHPRILALVLLGLDSEEAGAYYWRHVTPWLPSWWARQAQHVEETGIVQHLKPYTVAIEEFSVWQPRGAPVLLPPHALVKAVESIVAGLSSMTSSLVGKHHVWIKQQGRVPSKQEPLPLKVAQHKEVLECTLESYERMRLDPFWIPAISALNDDHSCRDFAAMAAWVKSQREMAVIMRAARLLSNSTFSRLHACFSPLVVDQADRTEASSTLAYEELMEEEKQEAARAATRKAKKLRQKAKKQQAQQVDSPPQDPTPTSSESVSSESESAPQSGLESSPAGLQLASSSSGINSNSMAHATEPSAEAQLALVLKTPPQSAQLRPGHAQAALTPAQQADAGQVLEGLPGTPSAIHEGCGSAASVTSAGLQEAAPGPANGAHFLQNLLRCPLSKALMKEPVIAADGHTYERAALEGWLLHSSTSPVTGDPLAHTRIVPNVLIRSLI